MLKTKKCAKFAPVFKTIGKKCAFFGFFSFNYLSVR